jgi:hypothetical protein
MIDYFRISAFYYEMRDMAYRRVLLPDKRNASDEEYHEHVNIFFDKYKYWV